MLQSYDTHTHTHTSPAQVYNNFLRVLQSYKDGTLSIEAVKVEIGELFKGHPTLLEQVRLFTNHVPGGDMAVCVGVGVRGWGGGLGGWGVVCRITHQLHQNMATPSNTSDDAS